MRSMVSPTTPAEISEWRASLRFIGLAMTESSPS
jgi:hypothetical protein